MTLGLQSPGDNGVLEKYCYNDDPNNRDTYGGLYQWNEALQYVIKRMMKGICLEGWHIPSLEEFNILSEMVYGDGNKLLSLGQGNGSNDGGFSALLGGFRGTSSAFHSLGSLTGFWNSSGNTPVNPSEIMEISLNNNNIQFIGNGYICGFSIRCMKD